MASWHEYYNLPTELRFDNDTIEKVWKMRPLLPHKIRVFGKEYDTPRLQQAYGRNYPFSGMVAKSAGPIPEVLIIYYYI